MEEPLHLDVAPIVGDAYCFMVRSEDGSKLYRVDFEDNRLVLEGRPVRNGACSCPHFQIRSGKHLRDGRPFRCKHIKAAGWFLLDCILDDHITKHRPTC